MRPQVPPACAIDNLRDLALRPDAYYITRGPGYSLCSYFSLNGLTLLMG